MSASSSFPSIPNPSTVCFTSSVPVKLSGRNTYDVWKTHMICLLESNDMLGYINGRSRLLIYGLTGKEKFEGMMAWRRSDALVKGWILGSLSEQTFCYILNRLRLRQQTNSEEIFEKFTEEFTVEFTAQDLWDSLRSQYDPLVIQKVKDSPFYSDFERFKDDDRLRNEHPFFMYSSPSNPFVNFGEEYPYPSHVYVPSFVTVKLSGREMYDVWKTQMLGLLKCQDMLGFIDGTFRSSPHNMWWKRSDDLVKGWILGSLSEQTLGNILNFANKNPENITAKDVWDKLQTIYGPRALLPQQSELVEEEEKEVEEEENSVARASRYEKDDLYAAILKGRWKIADEIMEMAKISVTDKITINGNTTLHVAVGNNQNKMLEEMLNLATKESPKLDIRNSEGSTLLHIAASVGNTEAAKILVEKNRDLLFAKDNNGDTPLNKALSNMHTETFLYLLNLNHTNDIEMGTLFDGKSGENLLVNVISSKDFGSALVLLKNPKRVLSDATLMAIAQNFPSEPNKWALESEEFICSCTMGHTLLDNVWPFKFLVAKAKKYNEAERVLYIVTAMIPFTDSDVHKYYTNPIFEATRQNVPWVVELIINRFPNAIWSTNTDGHNIIEYAVLNRSENVYNLLYQMSELKNTYRTFKDSSGNNLLHLVARLAPTNKLNLMSGAALQIQHELQWFQEIKRFVCPLNVMQCNSSEETPGMVFTREHKELVIEGEKWMKETAESYTITAALITTIVFAAAITVPGGNTQDTGLPVFNNKTAFKIFAISDAISLFTSVTSLLMFLSILTARFAEQDFLYKLPTKLIIGLVTLFISTTAMIIAFGATLFLVFGQSNSWILVPIAALTCLPITSFVSLQFPLVWDLISATYGTSIFGKKVGRFSY